MYVQVSTKHDLYPTQGIDNMMNRKNVNLDQKEFVSQLASVLNNKVFISSLIVFSTTVLLSSWNQLLSESFYFRGLFSFYEKSRFLPARCPQIHIQATCHLILSVDFNLPETTSLHHDYASTIILGSNYNGYSFIICIKYEESSTLLCFVYIVLYCFGESCVSDHNCMFTCRRNGAIFKGIFVLFIEDGSFWFHCMWCNILIIIFNKPNV